MLIYRFVITAVLTSLVLLCVLLCAACGGSNTSIDTGAEVAGPAGADSLPLPGSGIREGSIVDNDSAWGMMYYDAQHNTDAAPTTVLEATGTGVLNSGFALYQILARVGETPHTLTVNALLTDKDPHTKRAEEAYWVAYGDFSGGAEGVWRFAGPFTSQQARVPLPAGVNVVNGAGLIFVAVLALDNNKLQIGNVQIGYDLGEGFEEYRLAQPRGSAVGVQPQIALDSDGNPQIAYLESSAALYGLTDTRLKVARLVGGEWVSQVVTVDPVEDYFAFACGANGRRAVVVEDHASSNIWLYYDEGGGEFSTVALVDATGNLSTAPALAFINSLDDPAGELDTVLIAYADNYVYPNVDVQYFVHYGGVNPPTTGTIALATLQMNRLELMVEGNQATLGLLNNAMVPPDYDCAFYRYDSVVDSWAPSTIPNLTNLDINQGDLDFAVQLAPLGGGQYVAAYMSDSGSQAMFWKFDGISWATQPSDQVASNPSEPWLDYAVFDDGTQVYPANYGDFKLAAMTGEAGSGSGFDFHPLTTDSFSSFQASIAASGTTAHIASANLATGALEYYKLEADGTSTTTVVDNGSEGLGRSLSPTQTVVADGRIHIFSADSPHTRIMHSENHGGQWVREADPIMITSGLVYYLLGAGYLESTGQLWVGYGNLSDLGLYVLTGTPDGAGGWDWESHKFVGNAGELIGIFADDETNIGCTYINFTAYSQYSVKFGMGPSTGEAASTETISTNLEVCDLPWHLGYNPVLQTWDFAATDQIKNRCLLYHRNGPDKWVGPYTAVTTLIPGDSVHPAGFTYAEDTGRMRLVTREFNSAVGLQLVNVYGQLDDDWNFAAPINVLTLNSVTDSLHAAFVTADSSGLPVIAAMHKLMADTSYTIDFYEYDGLGNWLSNHTWVSPFSNITASYFEIQPLQLLGPGKFVFAATNLPGPADSNNGIVYILYPW